MRLGSAFDEGLIVGQCTRHVLEKGTHSAGVPQIRVRQQPQANGELRPGSRNAEESIVGVSEKTGERRNAEPGARGFQQPQQ